MFRALADLAHGRARLIFALTWVFVVLAGVFGGPVAGLIAENEGDDFADPASQSVAADERFVAATGREPGTGLVLLVRAGAPVDGPAGGRKVAAVAAAVAAEEGVAQVVTYAGTRDRGLVSRDGRSTYLPVVLSGDADDAGVYEELQERFEGRDDVLVGGGVAVNEQVIEVD